MGDEMTEINDHWKWNWRKSKKYLRNRSFSIERSGYFEDCRCHPCEVTDLRPYRPSNPWSFYESEVTGKSLFNGTSCSCSMYHCAPAALTQADALERAAYYKENGMLAYLKKYIYGPMTAEQEASLIEFYKSWEWEI